MISANLATFKARKDTLHQTVDSLRDQVDVIRIYANDYLPNIKGVEIVTGEDLTDRGKFYFVGEDEIYFSCDDDIIYPENYVSSTLEKLKQYPNAILTYHGRKLLGEGRNYYHGHQVYHCLRTVPHDVFIDVAGTGVSCFDASKWKPDILKYPDQKMSDLLFSLEAKKAGKKIICLAHSQWWLTISTNEGAIYDSEHKRCDRQNEYADLILST